MKHVFKGTESNLKYIGQTELELMTVTLSLDSISAEDLKKINEGYSIAYVDDSLVFTDNSEIELGKKKVECREKIESEYKEHDQINTLMFGTEEEKTTMNTYVKACLDEYRNNGALADFSSIQK